jgi:hypothetical protein
MKHVILILVFLCASSACQKDPNACECGRNLMKSPSEQDASLKEACEEKVQSLPEEKQMDWYNQSMECMNEQ